MTDESQIPEFPDLHELQAASDEPCCLVMLNGDVVGPFVGLAEALVWSEAHGAEKTVSHGKKLCDPAGYQVAE